MLNILLVEDDDLYRQFLETLLRRHACMVICLPNGRRIGQMFGIHHFDLVVTDLYMPDCDGIETLRAVKQVAPETPVICLTGACERTDTLRRAMLEFGAAAVLSKMLSPADLARELLHAASVGTDRRPRSERA